MADQTKVVFKRKKRKGKKPSGLRKRMKSLEQEIKDSEQDDPELKKLLEETKFVQSMRRRMRGRGLEAIGDEPQEAEEEEEQADESDMHKEQQMLGMAAAFKAQAQENPVDKQMEKYIEEELAKRRSGTVYETKEEVAQPDADDEEFELYKTPAHLKVKHLDEADQEAGDRWLTGITEVALPISVKLKNIEETEKAKQELLNKSRPRTNNDLPANFNSNYKKHQRDWAKDKRAQWDKFHDAQRATESGGRGAGGPPRKFGRPTGFGRGRGRGGGGRGTASDDRVVRRFIKRESMKWK